MSVWRTVTALLMVAQHLIRKSNSKKLTYLLESRNSIGNQLFELHIDPIGSRNDCHDFLPLCFGNQPLLNATVDITAQPSFTADAATPGDPVICE